MSHFPGIFACANPDPEIDPKLVHQTLKGKPYIFATGRSDLSNQINNALAFPYIFRGALDAQAKSITFLMKQSASRALADLARDSFIPQEVKDAYQRNFEFGADYLLPTPFDPRLKERISSAVFQAAKNPR